MDKPTLNPAQKKVLLAGLDVVMDAARQSLTKDHKLTPAAMIAHATGNNELIPIPPETLESGRAKSALFKILALHCRKTGAIGFVFISDAWSLVQSEEQLWRMDADEAYRKQVFEVTRNDGLEAAAKLGMGSLVETIQCVAQSLHFACMKSQSYERIAADGVIPPTAVGSGAGSRPVPEHTIRFGPIETRSTDGDWNVTGRMFQLFKDTEEPPE